MLSDCGFQQIIRCRDEIRDKTAFEPEYAVILMRGLYDFINKMDVDCIVKYSDLPSYPVLQGKPQEGQLVFGTFNGKKLVVMMGRLRERDGYGVAPILFPIRLFKQLGATKLINTNAVGGISPDFPVGSYALIRDHLSIALLPPLRDTFWDDSEVVTADAADTYSRELNNKILSYAKKNGIIANEAVLVSTVGPQYETPAEIRAYSILGADVVAQSGIVEGACARYIGLDYCLLSAVGNIAAGVADDPVTLDIIISGLQDMDATTEKLLEAVWE